MIDKVHLKRQTLWEEMQGPSRFFRTIRTEIVISDLSMEVEGKLERRMSNEP
jgi:hypothetical protein